MAEAIRKVNIIGHLNPDTDSICAAISYAYLKNQIDNPIYEARRAGSLNRETAFVLNHFWLRRATAYYYGYSSDQRCRNSKLSQKLMLE